MALTSGSGVAGRAEGRLSPIPTGWLAVCQAADPRCLDPLVLPARFATATYSEIATPKLRRIAADYCHRFWDVAPLGTAPVFLGRVQTWKTYAAAFLARYVYHEQRLNTIFVQCGVEFSRLERERFAADTGRRIAALIQVPFLVLDDFPLVAPGSYAAAMLIEVVTARFDERRPTCLTGNILMGPDDTSELDHRYGPQFGRRVYDMGRGFIGVIR